MFPDRPTAEEVAAYFECPASITEAGGTSSAEIDTTHRGCTVDANDVILAGDHQVGG